MAYLKIKQGVDLGHQEQVIPPRFTLGRSKNADFCINDPSISRSHADIVVESSRFFIEDQNSNNGIWVNDTKVKKQELAHGDIITLGNTQIEFGNLEQKLSSLPFDNLQTESEIVYSASEDVYDQDKSIILDANALERLQKELTGSGPSVKEGDFETHKKMRMLQAMLKVSNAVGSQSNLPCLLEELLDVVFEETKANRGFILLYDEGGKLTPMSIKKRNQNNEAITISHTIINKVVQEKQAILSSDMMNDSRFNAEMSIVANQIRSCMCAPLLYQGEVIGAVHIDSDLTTNIFQPEDLELLTAIANQVAICISHFKISKQLTEEENKRSKLSQFFPPTQVDMLMSGQIALSLGGKTEHVSILFCDIRSFTRISENQPPGEVMNFLNDFFTVMTEIIFKHDGMVDNFMGDCIMAVFGGPLQTENEAQRTIQAAIEMQKAQEELNKKFAVENRQTFKIGIGIHSGDVSRGNVGSPQMKKYTVIGSTVNVAARLCGHADSDEIIISKDTATNLHEKFKLDKNEPIQVKNVTEPLLTYKVIY